ncbi:helix-turn-helix transcriptional regulator [Hyphomonas sp.]|uniref:helix-turn-helix transcriptional regulator n=1 Tax=Hyphomonas sp. TaxID=87 RepID=UPI00349FF843
MRRAHENIIRALRTERGWSQQELADKLDVSRQSVNAIETGKYDPSLPLAFALARLFGRNIEELFDDGAGVTNAAEQSPKPFLPMERGSNAGFSL